MSRLPLWAGGAELHWRPLGENVEEASEWFHLRGKETKIFIFQFLLIICSGLHLKGVNFPALLASPMQMLSAQRTVFKRGVPDACSQKLSRCTE